MRISLLQIARLCFTVIILAGGVFLFLQPARATYGDVITFVGSVYAGDGGPATAALLDFPEDAAADASGNLFIADTFNNAIRKVGSDGTMSTLAGGGYGVADGTGTTAMFGLPRGVATDADGNVYVADESNNAIRKVTPGGVVTTLVNTGLSGPYGVAVAGSTLFIADTGNNALKSVSVTGGTVTTITLGLNAPRKIAVSADGSTVYVADTGSFRVLSVAVGTGSVAVLAGSGTQGYAEGTGSAAQFNNLLGIALAADGATLYVSDPDLYHTDRIRSIAVSTGVTALFATDASQQKMIFPAGLTIAGSSLYAAMSGLGTVRSYRLSDGADQGVAAGSVRFGSRDGSDPLFGRPHDLTLAADGTTLYIADNNHVRAVSLATKATTTVIGSVVDAYQEGTADADDVAWNEKARFSTIAGIVATSDGKTLYVADRWNSRIRKLDLAAGRATSSLVSGAGRINGVGGGDNAYQEGTKCAATADRTEPLTVLAGCAYFQNPTGIALDPTEEYLYVADTGNQRIRKVHVRDGSTSLVAGSTRGFADGVGAAAQFDTPWGLALSPDGTTLYVADRGDHHIRAIDLATSTVTTLAGSGRAGYLEGIGTAAYFSYPTYLKMGADEKLYVTEVGSYRIRQIDPQTGLTKLVAGSGSRGYVDGTQQESAFNNPEGIAPNTSAGTLYIADSWNDVIRQVDVQGTAPYASPAPTVTSAVPNNVARGWATPTGLRIKIKGTDFRHGAKTTLYTYPASKTAVVSSTEIVVTLPLAAMQPGWYDITVTNVDGQFGFLENGFGLRDPGTGKVPDEYFSVSEVKGVFAFPKTERIAVQTAAANVLGDGRAEVIAGRSEPGSSSEVRVLSNDGTLYASWYAFGKNEKDGVRLAACDLDGNGRGEIVAVSGASVKPRLNVLTAEGKPAFAKKGFALTEGVYTGGPQVACADVNGDGKAEIIVVGSTASDGAVRVYDRFGKRQALHVPFGKKAKNGMRIATIDTDADGAFELLVSTATAGGRVVLLSGTGAVRLSLRPFGTAFRGGVSVAAGDTDGDHNGEIVVSPLAKSKPFVRVLSAAGKLLSQFLAYPRSYRGGVQLTVGDVNGDGIADIVTSTASRFTPSVRMFHQNGKPL